MPYHQDLNSPKRRARDETAASHRRKENIKTGKNSVHGFFVLYSTYLIYNSPKLKKSRLMARIIHKS
jgi:hypothetical protein